LLLDNGYHADVMNEGALLRNLSRYPVIAIMEQTHLPTELREAVLDWVHRGGKLLLTGSHLAHDFGGALGVKVKGDPTTGACYLPAVHPGVGEGVPGSVPVPGTWQPVRLAGAKMIAPLLRTPEPRSAMRSPAATLVRHGAGSIAAVHGPLATAYGGYRYPGMRAFAGQVLKALTGAMPVQIDAPPYVHMTVRQAEGRRIVHLINTSSTNPLAPVNPMIEAVPEVGPITLRARCATRPKSVTLEPGHRKAQATWRAGVLTVKVGALHIHSAVVIAS
jgi:hypothetical protein